MFVEDLMLLFLLLQALHLQTVVLLVFQGFRLEAGCAQAIRSIPSAVRAPVIERPVAQTQLAGSMLLSMRHGLGPAC